MLKREDINEIFGISESYEMPNRVMKILFDKQEREQCFEKILKLGQNMSEDMFRDYYQEEHGDRDKLKQDFTPDCVARIAAQMTEGSRIADICAGSGSLTIKAWEKNEDAFFHCEEYSKRTIPILLLNLMIRNINAEVIQCDCLTGRTEGIYRIRPGERFANVFETDTAEKTSYDSVIMNPPYSFKWKEVDEYTNDERFKNYGVPPKQFADYAFIMHGMSKLEQGGRLAAIVPMGVLFRGGREQKIREKVIEEGWLDAVAGLPENMFLNTCIPVCMIVLRKRENEPTLFIDASKEYEKHGKQNVMNDEHVKKLLQVYRERRTEKRYSQRVSVRTIRENEYNLNIPRYVDSYVPEELPDLKTILEKIHETDKEICRTEQRLYEMMLEMCGTTPEAETEIQESIEEYRKWMSDKYRDKEEYTKKELNIQGCIKE